MDSLYIIAFLAYIGTAAFVFVRWFGVFWKCVLLVVAIVILSELVDIATQLSGITDHAIMNSFVSAATEELFRAFLLYLIFFTLFKYDTRYAVQIALVCGVSIATLELLPVLTSIAAATEWGAIELHRKIASHPILQNALFTQSSGPLVLLAHFIIKIYGHVLFSVMSLLGVIRRNWYLLAISVLAHGVANSFSEVIAARVDTPFVFITGVTVALYGLMGLVTLLFFNLFGQARKDLIVFRSG